jgi:beta-lactamase class A
MFSAAAGAAAVAAAPAALAAGDQPAIQAALLQFLDLPGNKSYQIDVGDHGKIFRTSYKSARVRFVGSAVKTFILARFLQDVEEGRLDENELLDVSDDVRSLSSPVLLNLTGQQGGRYVLEAMIAHSDNTATDIALKQVGPDRVREFIRLAGLKSVRIPDSTRRLFSYLAGAPVRVDKGWKGMLQLEQGHLFGEPRPSINNVESMLGNCNDLVSYYRRALKGEFFQKEATLVEFKRIHAMADALPRIVPPDIAAYGKGGSIDDFQGFHAFCVPGQMVIRRSRGEKIPVTFCFIVNWMGPQEGVPAVAGQFGATIRQTLAKVNKAFG